MSGKKGKVAKGGAAVKERTDDLAHRIADAVPARARKANKKMARSMRKHGTRWGAAVAGVAAAAVGAVLGLAAWRRAKR
jgi:hypothetical protein